MAGRSQSWSNHSAELRLLTMFSAPEQLGSAPDRLRLFGTADAATKLRRGLRQLKQRRCPFQPKRLRGKHLAVSSRLSMDHPRKVLVQWPPAGQLHLPETAERRAVAEGSLQPPARASPVVQGLGMKAMLAEDRFSEQLAFRRRAHRFPGGCSGAGSRELRPESWTPSSHRSVPATDRGPPSAPGLAGQPPTGRWPPSLPSSAKASKPRFG